MTRLRTLSLLVLVACLTMGIAAGSGAASAASHHVICKIKVLHKKRVVSCPKGPLRGKRGAKGTPGAPGTQGPAGPTGPTAGAGSGLNLNFNAHLTPNKTKELTVNNFTVIAASNAAGACEPVRLRAGGRSSRLAVGAGGEFGFLGSNEVANLTNGKNSNMFTAVTEDGGSTMSGIVGAVTAGGVCLVSGYVTGV